MQKRVNDFRKLLADVWFGMSLHETVRMYNRTRGSMDHLFMLVTFGDLVGMPIIPPYYTLRLLPFLVPSNFVEHPAEINDATDF